MDLTRNATGAFAVIESICSPITRRTESTFRLCATSNLWLLLQLLRHHVLIIFPLQIFFLDQVIAWLREDPDFFAKTTLKSAPRVTAEGAFLESRRAKPRRILAMHG